MRRSALLVLVAVVVAGCTSDKEPDLASGTSTSTSVVSSTTSADVGLLGTRWVGTRCFVGDREVYAEPPAQPASFDLGANGLVTGHDGCNGFGYSAGAAPDGSGDLGKAYVITDSSISFNGSPVSTAVGCSEQEYRTAFRSVLTGSVSYVIKDRTLVLRAPDGHSVEFRPAER